MKKIKALFYWHLNPLELGDSISFFGSTRKVRSAIYV